MSVAYIGPKSRTERPRKTKIGTEVGRYPSHVCDSDTTFKVKRSGGGGILWWPPAQLVKLEWWGCYTERRVKG